MPETESDSCTMLDMSASDSCVDLAIRRRSFPTRRVKSAKSGISANAKSASCQLRSSMPTIVATTVVTFDAIDVAVLVTTFWTPPMSFEMRDCTSPVRVRVKNASERRCRWRKTAARRSCITRWPTWFESRVWTTPSAPVTTAITIIPPALSDSARTSLTEIASSARLSKNAGITPSPAVTTMSRRTAESLRRYGANRCAIRRRLARRCTGSAGRSGASEAEWKNMPIVWIRVRRAGLLRRVARGLRLDAPARRRGGARLEHEETLAGAECVRCAGHRLDGEAAAIHAGKRVAGEELQVRIRLVDPQRHRSAAVGPTKLDTGDPVGITLEIRVGIVELRRADRPRRAEVVLGAVDGFLAQRQPVVVE